MVNNNKILTVSYGTFSCTLEGFDDSFDTMKAIAEYFRDLASDDRYFGAEPPQPDADMLARIAQREITRRVEAHTENGNLVLRAHEEEAPAEQPAIAAPVVAAVASSVATPEVAEAEIAETSATEAEADVVEAEAPEAEADVVEAEVPEAEADVVEAEVPEAEAEVVEAEAPEAEAEVVEAEAPEAEAEVVEAEAPEAEADVVEAEVPEAEAEVVEAEAPEAEADVVEAEAPEAEVEVTEAELPVEEAPAIEDVAAEAAEELQDETPAEEEAVQQDVEEVAETLAEETVTENEPETAAAVEPSLLASIMEADAAAEQHEVAAAPAEESIADKLQRIRAVVSRSSAADEEDDYLEDEDAEEMIAETASAIEEAPEADLADESDAQTGDASGLDFNNMVADVTADDIEEESEADAEVASDNLFAERESAEETDEVSDVAEPTLEEADAQDIQEDVTDADEEPMRARVLKVKRADFEAAIAAGSIEEDRSEADEELASSLSQEDEAELQRDLAEVESAIEENTEETPAIAEEEEYDDEQDAEQNTGAKLFSESIKTEDDLSRLMAETESQMDEPESSLRRDAFAHLRAAVAATKAEETLGTGDTDDDTSDAYRDDLASVVKPRRPTTLGARTARPAESRPAPLKLVAEQRIDTEEGMARGPVRPRRVDAGAAETIDTSSGEEVDEFAKFIQDMGATELPDLVEAAASYMAFAEGRDQFSRPQLMAKVRQIQNDDYSREDGLRSFGQLLRSGKIKKIKGGRFAVSDQIGFRPDPDDSRAVAG